MADGSGVLVRPQSSALMRCREIGAADLAPIAALLHEGFPEREIAYWRRGLEALAARDLPAGLPRFGFMLEAGGEAVGVLLALFAEDPEAGPGAVRCNNSSWYVREAYRGAGMQLVSRVHAYRGATFLNISPAEHTLPVVDAMGYRRYVEGQVLCLPALGSPRGGRVERFDPQRHGARLFPHEAVLLSTHAALGCIALVCEADGVLSPFVFLRRHIRRLPLGTVQLVWCRSTDDFVRLSGPLGRWLLIHRGAPLALLDATGPTPGLVGRFFKDRSAKYFRGPHRPRPNDLAFTEAVVFGF